MVIISQKLDLNDDNFCDIIKILAERGAISRVVGGAVRDAIFGLKVKDIDIATDITPDEVIKTLAKRNITCKPTGINYGTVTAILKGQAYEITTLRSDISCDGRRANVQYCKDFAIDAARRDFTINALSYCPLEAKIYDYFAGYDDLQNRVLQFIGEPKIRIKEDYLRILRFFRFTARFDWQYNEAGLDSCYSLAEGLTTLSQERIKQEFNQILDSTGGNLAIKLMAKEDILQHSLGRGGMSHKLLEIAKDSSKINLSLGGKYALLYGSGGKPIEKSKLMELRHSRQECAYIIKLLALGRDSIAGQFSRAKLSLIKTWLSSAGQYAEAYLYCYCFALAFADNPDVITKLEQINIRLVAIKTKPKFPIASSDLIELGYSGKDLGQKLNQLESAWLDSYFAINKRNLLNSLKP